MARPVFLPVGEVTRGPVPVLGPKSRVASPLRPPPPVPWSCVAQRVACLSSCARRSDDTEARKAHARRGPWGSSVKNARPSGPRRVIAHQVQQTDAGFRVPRVVSTRARRRFARVPKTEPRVTQPLATRRLDLTSTSIASPAADCPRNPRKGIWAGHDVGLSSKQPVHIPQFGGDVDLLRAGRQAVP